MDPTLTFRRVTGALVALALGIAALAVAPPALAQEAEEPEAGGTQVDRIAGDDRVQTAIAISQEAFPDAADTVVLARPDDYADALAGGPLAAALDAPLLLARDADHLDDGVLAEIERLGAGSVVILGGEEAVSSEVADALDARGDVERIAGADRFATAQDIARRLDQEIDVAGAVLVQGRDPHPLRGFPDAVSASWWAAQQGYAILPVLTAAPVPEGTIQTIEGIEAGAVYIVGGEAAVSEDVVADLADFEIQVTERLGGANRYETSALVWDTAVVQGADPAQRWVATGTVFADALSAGPAVAHLGYTLALVPPDDLGLASLPSAQIVANTPEYLDRIAILGGEAAVSPQVETQITTLVTDDLGEADYCLTVLHNNDGESQLPYSSSSELFGGVARFASVVERERQLAEDGFDGDGCDERQSILLNSGDNFLASPELAASRTQDFDPWYDVLALDAIGYDAFAVGNHEFDFGVDVLDEFINDFGDDAVFVSANLEIAGTALEGDIVPSVTIEKGSRTIGVIGATTPALPTISSPEDVEVQDLETTVQTVNDEAARLRGEDGADIVILQSHLQNIDEDIALIAQTSDVDIAVAGGGDELLGEYGNLYVPDDAGAQLPAAVGPEDAPLPGTYPVPAVNADNELVPVVTTTGDYRYVGRLRARFGADNQLVDGGSVDPRRSRLVRVTGADGAPDRVDPNPAIQEQVVEPVLAYTQSLAEQVVATTEVGLSGVRGEVRTRQTNVGSLLTDAYAYVVERGGAAAGLDTSQPIVAIANGGGIRNDSVIAEGGGDVTVQDTFNIAPFNNTVVAFDGVTASQLLPLLERGASGLPDAAGQFAQVGGISIEIDTSQTAQVVADGEIATEGDRIRSVTLSDGTVLVEDGAVVDDATEFILTTVNFTAQGGDAYPFAAVGLEPSEYVQVAPSYQQALQDFLEQLGTVTAADYPTNPTDRISIDGG
jgi:5'-nucleotidase